jgi:hypothetical protein
MNTIRYSYTIRIAFLLTGWLLLSNALSAQQQLRMNEFVLFGGTTTPYSYDSTKQVRIGPSVTIASGHVGSNHLVDNYGLGLSMTGKIISGNRVRFSNNFFLGGSIIANNSINSALPIIQSSLAIGTPGTIQSPGNIAAKGSVILNGGLSVTGTVHVPNTGTDYSGPVPGNGLFSSVGLESSLFPIMPVPPSNNSFGTTSAIQLTGSNALNPGMYLDMLLDGNDTIQFTGGGTYIFNSINNTGSNVFIFNALGSVATPFTIYVVGNAHVGRIVCLLTNAANASMVFTEVHGNGQGNFGNAFDIEGQAPAFSVTTGSNWVGTVWAPNASIDVTNGTAPSNISGALWSGRSVMVTNATINHVPFGQDPNYIEPYYPPPVNGKVDTANNPIGAELAALATYTNRIDTITNNTIFRISGDSVMIEVIALEGFRGDVYSFLVSKGFTDSVSNAGSTRILTGKFPIDSLLLLNTRPDIIDYARPLFPAINNNGQVTSQGDKTMRSDLARMGYDISGEGVKLGVFSDSYDMKSPGQARLDTISKDLPNDVQVLLDYPARASDEGRAMLQIIHDIAPKAKLAFRTGTISPGDFATGIRELADANLPGGKCDILVDDITWPTEPFFRDGRVAQAVNEVKAAGVTYFSAAGNFGSRSYENEFTPSLILPDGVSGSAHAFGSSNTQTLSLKKGTYMIVLQWDDGFYSLGDNVGVQSDLDMYLVGFAGQRLFGFNRSNLFGDPMEILPFVVTEDTEAELMIVKSSGNINPRFKFIIFRGDGSILNNSHPGSTLVGQANAEGAIAVGAILYANIPQYTPIYPAPASFSSVGGAAVRSSGNWVTRNKPELVAPNGVNTTVDLGGRNIDGDGYYNFFGTSAAAPHAAGAAALIMQAKKTFNDQASVEPDEIRSLLQSTTTDMGTPGFDYSSGFGLINTTAALNTFANPKPTIKKFYSTDSLNPGTAMPMPASISRFALLIDGENFLPTTRVYFNDSLIASHYLNENRIWARIDSFTGNPKIKLVTDAKSISNQDGGAAELKLFENRKLITISPRDTSRKYGQNNPVFQSRIMIDGVDIDQTSFTIESLGLDRLEYSTIAEPFSLLYVYPVYASINLDPIADSVLLADYIYQFDNPAALTVTKLPVKITPVNRTIKYGDDLGAVNFIYAFDPAGVADPAALLDTLQSQHGKYLADNAFAVISGYGNLQANGAPLHDSVLLNMSAMASYQSVRNARRFEVSNGKLIPLSSADSVDRLGIERLIIDVSSTSIYNSKVNPALAIFDSAYTGVHKRSFINAQKLATGTVQSTLNGQLMAMINGQLMAMINGQLMALVNGSLLYYDGNTYTTIDSLVINNGQLMAMINGQLMALVNGQLMALVNGVTVTIDINTAVEINGSITVQINGQLMALVNGQLMAMINGQLMAMINGQLMALVNGQLMALVNGRLMALVNGELKIVSSLSIQNGQLMAVINGQLMALVNGQLMALVNGQLMALVNGQLMALVNGEYRFVSFTNGQLMALVNDAWVQVNGQLMAMVNGRMEVVSEYSIQNGQLMAVINGQLMALVNGQLMALVNGQLMALVNDLGFAAGSSNTKSGVIVDEDDVLVQNGAIGGMFSVNMITSLEPGIQKLVPGTFTHEGFEVSYGLGDVTILPAELAVSVKDTSRTYGYANPSFEITTSGFAFGDNASAISSPVANCIATVTSPAGEYPITLSGGDAGARYVFIYRNGVLTVNGAKTPLTIKANLVSVNQGSPLPVFTSTITGLLNNDAISNISYSGSLVNTAIAGEYNNMPSVDTNAYPQYQITFEAGKIYVNPYGTGAKKIIVKRECVKQLSQPVRGYTYMAVFSYTNPNPTPVCIPRGSDNFISIANGGSFENTLPEVFRPGTHMIAVYFSGHQMYWMLRSIESYHKSAVTSDVNATTNCDAPVVSFTQVKKELQTEAAPEKKFALAPNPATSTIRLTLPGSWIRGSEVICMDAAGRKINLQATTKAANSALNINLAGLSKGIYFVSIQTTEGYKTLRFVKQ